MMLVRCGVIALLHVKPGGWLLSVKKFAGQPVAQEPVGWKLMSQRKHTAKRRTLPGIVGGAAPTMMLYVLVSSVFSAWLCTCMFAAADPVRLNTCVPMLTIAPLNDTPS